VANCRAPVCAGRALSSVAHARDVDNFFCALAGSGSQLYVRRSELNRIRRRAVCAELCRSSNDLLTDRNSLCSSTEPSEQQQESESKDFCSYCAESASLKTLATDSRPQCAVVDAAKGNPHTHTHSSNVCSPYYLHAAVMTQFCS
jgi:hypothetical protein